MYKGYANEYRYRLATDPTFATRHRAHQKTRYWRDPALRNRNRNQQRLDKLALVTAVKMEHGCVDCGYNEHPEALHFDHLPGTNKKFNVALATNLSEEKLWEEIGKCEVVCANCHAARTSQRRNIQ